MRTTLVCAALVIFVALAVSLFVYIRNSRDEFDAADESGALSIAKRIFVKCISENSVSADQIGPVVLTRVRRTAEVKEFEFRSLPICGNSNPKMIMITLTYWPMDKDSKCGIIPLTQDCIQR